MSSGASAGATGARLFEMVIACVSLSILPLGFVRRRCGVPYFVGRRTPAGLQMRRTFGTLHPSRPDGDRLSSTGLE